MALRQTEPVKETVGEYNFYITPFPAFKAANLTGELASVLAPIFGAVAPIVGEGDLMDADASKVASAMMNSPAISGDKLEKLMQKLLLGGHIVAEVPNDDGDIEPQRLDMDLANEIFCGEVQDMFILCFHVIKLNFNGFFKKLAAQSGRAKEKGCEENEKDLVKYGSFDYSQFNELELRCYVLIKARLASMFELQEVYTLDQALKLYALYEMELDIEKGRAEEFERRP